MLRSRSTRRNVRTIARPFHQKKERSGRQNVSEVSKKADNEPMTIQPEELHGAKEETVREWQTGW